MDIKAFKNKKNRKVVNGKSGNKNIRIQIINYTEELYKKWSLIIDGLYKSGIEELQLTDSQIKEMFDDFTNVKFTLEELNDILEDPNHTFNMVFTELQIILNEMIDKYLQQKQLEIATTRKTLEETNFLIESGKLQEVIDNIGKHEKEEDSNGRC